MLDSPFKARGPGPVDPSFTRLEEEDSRPSPPLVLVAFLFPAFAGFNFGFDIGSTSGAIQRLRGVPDASVLDGSSFLQGLLTSGSLFGTVLGTCLSFVVAGPLGRRGELLLASGLYLLGTCICVFAPSGPSLLTMVFAGRGIFGMGVAFAMHAAPVYISEISPPSIRGVLVSLKEGFIVLGILAGFGMSAATTAFSMSPDSAWRTIWAPPALVAGIVAAGMFFMPASPRWLLLRARSATDQATALRYAREAQGGLRRLRSRTLCGSPRCDEDEVQAELDAIASMVGTPRVVTAPGGPRGGTAPSPSHPGGRRHASAESEAGCGEVLQARRALLAGLGLVLLQQVTGQPSVLYYQEAIFRDAGFGDLAAYASVIVGGAKLLATLFTVLRVDSYGRRPLLFAGITLMLVSLIALAIAFYTRPLNGPEPEAAGGEVGIANVIIVCSLMVYVCGYQIGFGPIAWLMISEVFPLRTRGTALSIAVTVNFGFNLLVTFTLPSIQEQFDALNPGRGIAYLFTLYAAFCVASLAFTHRFVPETKGKSLEQIERELRD